MASAKEQKESELQVTCKLHNHVEFQGYNVIRGHSSFLYIGMAKQVDPLCYKR